MFRRTAIWAFVLLLPFALSTLGHAQHLDSGIKGPYLDEVWMPIIKDAEAQLLAFQRGEVHVFPGLIRSSDIRSLYANPNVEITMDLGYHVYHLAFNMRREPLNDPILRRAMAHLVDREELILSLFDGYMLPLADIVPPSSPFHNPNSDVATYDPPRARALLDEAGYRMGPNGIRIDPVTGEPLRPLILYTVPSSSSPTSTSLAHEVAQAFRAEGIPVEVQTLDFNALLDRMLRQEPETGDRNFDMYMLALTFGRFPTHLYTLFHSSFDVDLLDNTVGMRNDEYDALAEIVWRPRDLAEAYAASNAAQVILAELQPYIPLYSRPYIDAFRSDIVTGFVSHLGFGAASNPNASPWTPLSLRRVDSPAGGGSVRWLLREDPQNLNVLVGRSAYDAQVFGFIYDALINTDPVTNEDVPGLALKWEVDTWVNEDGVEGSVITYHLREGVTWHDGVPFTAEDVKFTMDYIKEQRVPKFQVVWQEYSHSVVHDDFTISVYYDTVSYWHTYNTGSYLPRHIWEDVTDFESFQPWLVPHPEVDGLTMLVGHGPFAFKAWEPGEYVHVVRYDGYWRSLDL